jgi:hypothetical protein
VLADKCVGVFDADGFQGKWFVGDDICDNICHGSVRSLSTFSGAVAGVLPLGGQRSVADTTFKGVH